MKDYARSERVGEQVKSVLANALLKDIQDPRLQQVSLMAVHLSDGLESGRVFWLPLNPEGFDTRAKKRIHRAFKKATPFLRGKIARALQLRVVPELVFEYDEATAHGRQMDAIIEHVREQDAQEYPHLVEDDSDEEP